MKHLFTLIILILLTVQSIAQKQLPLTEMELKGELKKQNTFQFSSILIKGDSIILMAEKCSTIYFIDKNSLNVITSKNIGTGGHIKSIEGMALYKDRYIFMLDEGEKAVFCYDLQGKYPLRKITNSDWPGCEKDKMEGLAINPEKELCYVLHEENATITAFKIGTDMQLAPLEDKTSFQLPRREWTRWTDLLYEDGKFFVLVTDYRPNNLVASYAVEVYQIGQNNSVTHIRTDSLTHCQHLNPDYNYSYNLEGLAKVGNLFYIVSDNVDSSDTNCGPGGKKTILFSYKSPSDH